MSPYKHLHMEVHHGFIDNSQTLKKKLMDKQIVIHIYNETLLSNKKEHTAGM